MEKTPMPTKTATRHENSFSYVLTQYVPDYQPLTTNTKALSKETPVPDEAHVDDENKTKDSIPQTPSKPSRADTRSKTPKSKGTGYSKSASPAVGEPAKTKKSKSDAQLPEEKKHEKLSLKWDQAKFEVRQDQYEQLLEKVQLQKQLIKHQDALARQKKDQQEREAAQRKEEEKAKKHALEESLQKKCKESLEEDRRALQQQKKSQNQENAKTTESDSTPSSPTKKVFSPAPARGFQSSLSPVSRTPTNLDLDFDPSSWQPASQAEMEWYQSQLYEMFGTEADTFLHPKIEQQAKKPINPKLAKQGGRAGAEKLWNTLRKESIIRLLKEDSSIPKHLKDTYSSFVRQSLGCNRKIVRRNFYAIDDVPELGRLMDQSVLNRVRQTKHKIDLMFRASISNEDRTKILTENNPLPSMQAKDVDLTSCVGQYLPSWQDNLSEESEPDYKKWLTARKEGETTARQGQESAREDKQDVIDDELILLMTRKRRPAPQPKYMFLTEDKCKQKGKFSDKFKDQREYKDKPRPYDGPRIDAGSKSAMPNSRAEAAMNHGKRSDSAPIPQKHLDNYDSYLTSWEPLTMHALIEYKKKIDVDGEDDFKFGRAPVWKTNTTVS